ncbi:MAG: rhodanese-like domain-containing protein [Gammaproteobacteria bacterium]|nr:rhodanese-like domain-containing protein [Gammaproteobacteria bacterium]
MKHFSPTQLLEHLTNAQTQPLLLDVREPWEYEICHLANSTLIPMGQIHIQQEELDKNQETVVICHHGVRSRQIAMYLEHAGFKNIINLSGGVDAWAQDIDLDMAKY